MITTAGSLSRQVSMAQPVKRPPAGGVPSYRLLLKEYRLAVRMFDDRRSIRLRVRFGFRMIDVVRDQ